MKATYEELKEEIHRMKRRISALESNFDAIATKDDVQAMEEAHEDLRRGRTVDLGQVKKSL